jgi:hypothetical protein
VPRFLALQDEWRRNPPAHRLLAAALKYRPQGDFAPTRQPTIAELRAALPNGAL